MIEIVSAARCTGCNICVLVCPVNVFDKVADAAPIIARQEDCQTCYMCEAYCPADALYVAPDADEQVAVDEANLGPLGSYRRAIGWTNETRQNRASDLSYRLLGPR